MNYSNVNIYNSAIETSFPDVTNNHPKHVASSGFNGVFMIQLNENGYLITNEGVESFNTVNYPVWRRGLAMMQNLTLKATTLIISRLLLLRVKHSNAFIPVHLELHLTLLIIFTHFQIQD